MDSFVCAMSVMTPSEMMSRMKYCEPSVTADAYLKNTGGKKKKRVSNEPKRPAAASVSVKRLTEAAAIEHASRG